MGQVGSLVFWEEKRGSNIRWNFFEKGPMKSKETNN